MIALCLVSFCCLFFFHLSIVNTIIVPTGLFSSYSLPSLLLQCFTDPVFSFFYMFLYFTTCQYICKSYKVLCAFYNVNGSMSFIKAVEVFLYQQKITSRESLFTYNIGSFYFTPVFSLRHSNFGLILYFSLRKFQREGCIKFSSKGIYLSLIMNVSTLIFLFHMRDT